jgi:uncharacterized ParB-like nuclease family protein
MSRIKLDRIIMPKPVAAGMNPLVVMSLAYMMRSTHDDPPPITVRREGDYWRIVDGRHRYVAANIAGRHSIKAEEVRGGN